MTTDLFLLFLLFALAIYRLTRLLTVEHGFLGVFDRIRRRAGITYVTEDRRNLYGIVEPVEVPTANNLIGEILMCFYCTSVWVSMPFAAYLATTMPGGHILLVLAWWIVFVLALSAASLVVRKVGG